MTNDGIKAITYDAENHAVSSANGSSSGTYTYDGTGYRVEKTSGSTSTVYIFSGSKVIAEYDDGAAPISPTREYVYGGAALLAKIDSAGTKYYHQDHLSNRLVTDSSGHTLEQMGHYPFGYSWYNSTNDKLLFTSYERDAESANDYAMARTYINRLGRFSSPDPIAGDISDPQSLNRYTYARNIPVSLIDPTGMMEEESCDDSEDDSCGGGGGGYGSDGGVASWFFGTSGSSTDTGTQPSCDASGNCVFSITTSEPGPLTNPYYGDPSQGGGDLIGACPGCLSFPNRTPGPPRDLPIGKALEKLIKALSQDAECQKFLSSHNIDAIQMANAIYEYGSYGQQTMQPETKNGIITMTNAISGGTWAITVNSIGAFFNSSYKGVPNTTDRGRIQGGTPGAQGFILLHELGHNTNALAPDFGSQTTVDANDKALEKNCAKTVSDLSH